MPYTLDCPTGKRRFAFEWDADWALDRIWAYAIQGTTKSEKLPCRTYGPCKDCNGYHHTSQAKSEFSMHPYEFGLDG